MKDIPLLIVAVTISTYWSCVALMVARSWIKFRGPAGAVPKTRRERLMWLIWVPNTAAWIALPWAAWNASDGSFVLVGAGLSLWTYQSVRWLAALLAVLAFGLTTRCWLAMASNWTMAVNPNKPTELLTNGPFALVRHPIYALSLLLMLCTMTVVGTLPMLLVGVIHIAMIVGKAVGEERYLEQLHGESYRQYRKATNRFLPLRTFERA